MANRNLDNSKKITHIVGANCHAGSLKTAALVPATQGSGDCKQVIAILFAL